MQYNIHSLPNGIRVIHYRVPSEVAYCGLLVNTGSRDEKAREHGMAHFVEHVIFKGTQKRKSYHVLSRLDDVGGEINAYTTKEETVVHASFLKKDYNRAIDLITDIFFHPSLPEKEMDTEREVILDEINSYNDNPSELIFDEFEELIFKGHPMGRNILGTPQSLKRFRRNDMLHFMESNYPTNEMVFASVGDLSFDQVLKMVEKYLSVVREKKRITTRDKVTGYVPVTKTVDKKTHQSHCIIGNIAYPVKDERRLSLLLLSNILGGMGLNSRLNLSLREKHGYAYNVESSYHSYIDTGVIFIYFGADRENLGKSIRLVTKELQMLREQPLGTLQLGKARNQFIGQMLRGIEHHESLMLELAKNLLVFNKVDPVSEVVKKIQALQSKDLQEVANDILEEAKLSMLTYL
jgi:predicted Zn-dependent peptidase